MIKLYNQKGFTLMEVVVSIGIISILVGVVFGIYNLIINQIIMTPKNSKKFQNGHGVTRKTEHCPLLLQW